MERASYECYSIVEEKIGGVVPWLDNFVISFTVPGTFLPSFQTKFGSAKEFARAVMATSFVPMLMGLKTWARLENGRRVFDGYLGLWRIAFPDNYMYISFLPTIPQQVLR